MIHRVLPRPELHENPPRLTGRNRVQVGHDVDDTIRLFSGHVSQHRRRLITPDEVENWLPHAAAFPAAAGAHPPRAADWRRETPAAGAPRAWDLSAHGRVVTLRPAAPRGFSGGYVVTLRTRRRPGGLDQPLSLPVRAGSPSAFIHSCLHHGMRVPLRSTKALVRSTPSVDTVRGFW
jgi:hypothetical protein